MLDENSIRELSENLSVDLSPVISHAELVKKLADHINHLINHDFNRLVSILYRIDVNEKKLKDVLKENQIETAGNIIANLIIERQLQKIRSRRENRKDLPKDEEGW